jgi:ribose transport system permease protein
VPTGDVAVGEERSAAVAAPKEGRFRSAARQLGDHEQIGLFISLAIVIFTFSRLNQYFLTVTNELNIAQQVSYWGIAAAAQTLVLVGGALDLSVGAVMAFVGVMAGRMLEVGVPWEVVLLTGLAAGVVFGAVNGVLYAVFGINPLIVTIGTQFVIRGLAYWLAQGRDISILSTKFNYLGNGRIYHVPFFHSIPVAALVMIAVFVFFYMLMRMSRFGRHAYAIGGSAEAARLVGIPVTRRRVAMMIVSGLFAAVGGIVLAGYSTSGLAYTAQGIELQIIAAVVLGGAALMGGRGTVVGTLLGVLLIGIINDGIVLVGLPTYWQQIVTGGILLLAVLGDEVRAKLRAR